MEDIPTHLLVAGGGLVIGLAFGFTVHRSQFCMMGAVVDLTMKGDARRMRAWLLAIAVATAASQALQLSGAVDLGASIYLSPVLNWTGGLLGGLAFGFGMVIACGCGSRNLVNLGGGDLRALVALVFLGISAYTTMRGVLAEPRLWLAGSTALDLGARGFESQGLATLATGGTTVTSTAVAGASLAGALGWFCLRDRDFRETPRLWLAGAVLGMLVAAGWAVTGVLGADPFEETPLASLTFVAPVGNALQYLMTYTGAQVDFGVAVVGGVVAGGAASALLQGSFRLQAFEDIHDLGRYMLGGVLMGVGGVTAAGCTVGQGITGLSTLATGSVIATVAIMAGGVIGTRYLEEGHLGRALVEVVARR